MTSLRPGYRIRLLPRFAGLTLATSRLAVNGGSDWAGDACFPRSDWRPLTARELAMIMDDRAGATPRLTPPPGRHGRSAAPAGASVALTVRGHQCDGPAPAEAPGIGGTEADAGGGFDLFAIPEHLRFRWWASVAGADAPGSPESFRAFASSVLEFLRFKRMPIPEECECELVASRPWPHWPGPEWHPFPLITRTPESGPAGAGGRRLLGGVNLGDDGAWVLALNQPPTRTTAMGAPDSPATPAEFLSCAPSYPLTRIELGPGEGCLFPDERVAATFSPCPGDDVAVFLYLRGSL